LAHLALAGFALISFSSWPARCQNSGGAGQSDSASAAGQNQNQKPPTQGTGTTPAGAAAASASPAASPRQPATPRAANTAKDSGARTPSTTPGAQQAPPADSSGVVWVNTDTGVFHQPGTRYYGRIKQGKYMLEVDAKKAGYRAAGKKQ
jgi:hypothetical protein